MYSLPINSYRTTSLGKSLLYVFTVATIMCLPFFISGAAIDYMVSAIMIHSPDNQVGLKSCLSLFVFFIPDLQPGDVGPVANKGVVGPPMITVLK